MNNSVEEIINLKRLLDEKVITQDEFESKKRRLLGLEKKAHDQNHDESTIEYKRTTRERSGGELPHNVYNDKKSHVKEKGESSWHKFETLFYEYFNKQDKAAFNQMQKLPMGEIIEAYIKDVESHAFGLAHGWDYSPQTFDNPFKNFCDHNFGKFKEEVFQGYDDLDKAVKKCVDAFVKAYESVYPQKFLIPDIKSNVSNHTKEIVSFFILYHGYNASETVQGGVASYLGFKMRFNDFKSISNGYLWMFEENPDSFLDDFLEIYNTRVMNYLEKDVMFKTKPYDELTPLRELDFESEIEGKEHEAITELTKTIINNDIIMSSIKRNSDGHFISMLDMRLANKQKTKGETAISITQKLLEDKKSKSIMDYRGGLPHIPELMVQVDTVCSDLFTNLQNEIDNPSTFLTLCPMWCAYAGMGAVAKWNDNWPMLRDNGIIPSLIEERGYFAMDEYVMDYIGVGWDSEECKKVNSILHAFSVMLVAECIENKEVDMYQYSEALKGMYYYGIVYEMSRIGMH